MVTNKYIVLQEYSSASARKLLYHAVTVPIADLETARCYARVEREEQPKKRVFIVQVIEDDDQ